MNLRNLILIALAQAGEFKLPESVLITQLRQAVGADVPLERITSDMQWLKDKAYVDFTVEELSGERRWQITATGKAKLPR